MGEGGFTVAREQALLKLANYQLPFEGAWGMKVVQGAVAWGQSLEIKVTISRSEAVFAFQCPEELSLEEIENAFYNPEPHPDRAVRHLVSALWAIGVAQKHPFVLSFPHQESSLRWNGKELSYTSKRFAGKWTVLMVGSGNNPRSWNATLTQCLAQRCYTCPVPLTLDGRRLDGLQYCPSHGWTDLNFPLAVAQAQTDNPPLPIPSGTWRERYSQEWKQAQGLGLSSATLAVFRRLPRFKEAPLIALIAAHVQVAGINNFKPRAGGSLSYWVSDGVIVDERALEAPAAACSVAVFLSASGLRTDLSGLALAQSQEADQRLSAACRALSSQLEVLDLQNLVDTAEQGKRNSEVVGSLFLLAGVGLCFVSPIFGLCLMGAGVVSGIEGGESRVRWTKHFEQALKELAKGWRAAYPAE